MSDSIVYRKDVSHLIKKYFDENYIVDGAWYADELIRELSDLPSAEKTGQWIYKTTDAYIQRTCNACGWSERMYHRDRNQDGLIRNYCPNCGSHNTV